MWAREQESAIDKGWNAVDSQSVTIARHDRSKLTVSRGRAVDFGVTTGGGSFHHAMTIPKERSHYVLLGADRGGLS